MKSTLLLLVWALPYTIGAQNTFLKVYPHTDLNNIIDMVQVTSHEHAFITSHFFYRIDNNGNVLLKKNLFEGQGTFLRSIVADRAGHFYIAAEIFPTAMDSKLVLYKLTGSGQLLFKKPFAFRSSPQFNIVQAGNDRLFVTYVHRSTSQDDHLEVLLFDDQGQELWRKELPDPVYSFIARAGAHNTVEIFYKVQGHDNSRMLQADIAGNFSNKEIIMPQSAGFTHTVRAFCSTPDGGYAFAGETSVAMSPNGPINGLLFKTNHTGLLEWKQDIHIYRGERMMDLIAVNDGYVLLGDAGLENFHASVQYGDLALVKTNWKGDVQWTKTYGSFNRDEGIKVLAPDTNSLLIGARVRYPGYSSPITLLCKTDKRGELSIPLPFQPAGPSTFKEILVNDKAPVQSLARAIPAGIGNLITGGNFLDSSTNTDYPHVVKATHTGEVIWYKKITEKPSTLLSVAPTQDGHYIALTAQRDFLGKLLTLTKFTTNGDTLWTAANSSTISRDLIGVSDGGYLLAGAEDLTISDFDALFIKVDANGKEVWRKKTGIPAYWETPQRIMETPEHDFIIAGNAQVTYSPISYAWALKISSTGNVLWSKIFDAGTAVNYLYDVAITSDGGYVMVGSTMPDYGDKKDVLLIRLNKQGDKLWEKTYDLHLLDEGLSVTCIAGDSILVAGTTGEPPTGTREKYGFFMKLNKDGNRESIQYFGAPGVQTDVKNILITGEDVIVTGSTARAYGNGYMYLTKVNSILPAQQPPSGSLTIFPNPAHSKAFISLKNSYNGPVNIVLYNAMGQQVIALQRTKVNFELKETIPLPGLSAGVYYFFIQQGNDKNVKSIEIVNR